MRDKLFLQAASSLVVGNAMETLKDIAKRHDCLNDIEYKENMLMLAVIGHAIAKNKDKDYLLEVFSDLILMQKEDEEDEMINKASSLL